MTRLLRDLERHLLRETGSRLTRLGFASRPRDQTFLRPTDGGTLAVHLSFITHARSFDVTVDVAVRFDAVEELVHRSNRLLTKRDMAATFTLGVELGNLERGEPHRYTVADSSDVERVSAQLVEKIETVGMPYLENYSRPEAAFALLARDDRDARLHCPIHAERAKRACALLVVMSRHSEVEALGRQKLSFLESVRDPGATMFSRFLVELQSK